MTPLEPIQGGHFHALEPQKLLFLPRDTVELLTASRFCTFEQPDCSNQEILYSLW